MNNHSKYYKPSKAFWITNISGWLFLFIANTLVRSFFRGFNVADLTIIIPLIFGFIATIGIRGVFYRFDFFKKNLHQVILPIIIISIITTILVVGLGSLFVKIVLIIIPELREFIPDVYKVENLISNSLNFEIIILSWISLYFGIQYFIKAKNTKIEQLKLKAALQDAQLNILRGQLNPHFMFNSLNNIRALMLEDVYKSRDMITNLSELLRYILNSSKIEKVTLKDELEVVNKFLELVSIQFEEKLTYKINYEEKVLDLLLPPMMIQILVENAVKHGVEKLKFGGEIIINIIENDLLNIDVINTGEITKEENKNSINIGLNNIKERLKLLYGNNMNFDLISKNGFVTASIKLPKERK